MRKDAQIMTTPPADRPHNTVTVRLTAAELTQLHDLMQAPQRGTMNQSECIRYLIASEWNRTHGQPRPKYHHVATENRTGRPKGGAA